MTLRVPQNSEADALQFFVNAAEPENLVLRLYVNNVTSAETDTAEAYSEASGAGYAAIELDGEQWDAPAEGSPTSIGYPQQQFVLTGALGGVYGYFMTRAQSGRIALAERFTNGPYTISAGGGTIKITPRLTAD